MATLKIIGVGEVAKYHDLDSYDSVVRYIQRQDKTVPRFCGGIAVNPAQAALEMQILTKAYRQEEGSCLRHMVLSFTPREIDDMGHANGLAFEIAEYYGGSYQITWAVHGDKRHIHIHFIMNKVSYLNGKKYHGTKKDYYDVINHTKTVLWQLGIPVQVG